MCFVVSILCIGMVTAIIGDVASHFGCTLGIKDSVTAIVFVALGTSIPGRHLITYMTITMDISNTISFQIRLLVKWQQFKINTQMLVWVM